MSNTNKRDNRIDGGVVEFAAGKTNSWALNNTNNGASRVLSNINDRVGKANSRARTIGSWADKTIILSSLLAYIPKLKKYSRQSGNSFFSSCLIDIIWNITFANYYF